MNHTKNYNLPQWELNDLIRMEDFNAMNNSIEAGLDSNAAAAAEAKADAASAKIVANTAKAAAETALSEKPYVAGSYTGNGQRQTIEVGFRPSFVIISGMSSILGANNVTEYVKHFAISGGRVLRDRVSFTETGFAVIPTPDASSPIYHRYPDLAQSGTYDYIAFK